MKGGGSHEEIEGYDSDLEEFMINDSPRVVPWTQKEVSILKRYYSKVPMGIIAKRLSRTHASVRNKAQNLGLQRKAA